MAAARHIPSDSFLLKVLRVICIGGVRVKPPDFAVDPLVTGYALASGLSCDPFWRKVTCSVVNGKAGAANRILAETLT